MTCPIAACLDKVGHWWSMLILREALQGCTRFDEFERNLGISPAMLTRRLNALVDAGLLERRQYSSSPPRDEYVATAIALDFRPVLIAMAAWGGKHFQSGPDQFVMINTVSGEVAEPILVDRASGLLIDDAAFQFVPVSQTQAPGGYRRDARGKP